MTLSTHPRSLCVNNSDITKMQRWSQVLTLFSLCLNDSELALYFILTARVSVLSASFPAVLLSNSQMINEKPALSPVI